MGREEGRKEERGKEDRTWEGGEMNMGEEEKMGRGREESIV